VIEPELVFGGLETVPIAQRWPSTATSVSMVVPAGHQVVKKARSPSAMRTTDQQTACPQTVICVVELAGIEIGQFEIAPIMQPRSFGPSPADRRFQSDGRRVDAMSAAVPETDRRLPQDRNT